jgi:hypothetical protein
VEPERIRDLRGLVLDVTGYPLLAALTFDRGLPAYSIAGYGDGLLSGAIQCFVVGMDAEARELLAKSDRWLSAALERARTGEPLCFEADSYSDLVLCRRLADRTPDPLDLTRSAEAVKAFLGSRNRSKAREAWGFALPRLLLAGDAKYVIDEFRRSYPDYALPRRPRPAGMAYALARHRSGDLLDPAELAQATDRFLRAQIPALIDQGDYRECAIWALLVRGEGTDWPACKVVRDTFLRFA